MGASSWPSATEILDAKMKVSEMSGREVEDVQVVVSPYRICPLGAHIDHQGGIVSAMTINRGIILAFVPSFDTQVVLCSGQFSGEVKFSVDEEQYPRKSKVVPENNLSNSSEDSNWGCYARGALYALKKGNQINKGIIGFISGSEGLDSSGLSSSAAVGIAYLLALESANNLSMSASDNIDLDKIIENEYLGLRNGILDQSAILLSKYGYLTVMNCKTKAHTLVAYSISPGDTVSDGPIEYKILLSFSGVKHCLKDNPGYNCRVSECQEAAGFLLCASGAKNVEPCLCEVDPHIYETHKHLLKAKLAKRAEHYFSENKRVVEGVDAWASGNIVEFGRLISASGLSSIQNYECGFMALKVAKPKRGLLNSQKNLDLLFMSASASTVSSMGTIEMEVFSDSQLWVLTILMLFGGEVFTSMLHLQIMKANKIKRKEVIPETRVPISNEPECPIAELNSGDILPIDEEFMKSNAIRSLSTIVLSYLATVITMGSVLVLLYIKLVPSAKEVLERKDIKLATFSAFLTISSFTNCGFLPTNENMMPFKEDSFLQLLVIIIVLAGNTLFPSCLRFLIWVLNKLTKGTVYSYILHNPGSIGYQHLFTSESSIYLFSTVFVFIVVQIAAFCSLEWNSEALQKLNPFQKLIGALFQSVNARHAGESIIDMSIVAPAVLVLYIVMMYLPPYTRFLHSKEVDKDTKGKGRRSPPQDAIISKLSILAVFVIIICITERKAMVEDPLNFNVLNIVFEVISAYGNVGFSIGYSCKRMLNPDSSCKDAWYGFVGRWSQQGKLTLMLVMFFGRLKTSIPGGGKFWELL